MPAPAGAGRTDRPESAHGSFSLCLNTKEKGRNIAVSKSIILVKLCINEK